MIRIAICDDMPEDLNKIASLARQYLSVHGIDADVNEFSHPDSLLTAIETESFHLYILDIVMPMVGGLELGREIRKLDLEAQIIYATTEPQFALQAYAASPTNYLIKPVDSRHLFDTLTFAISKTDLDEPTFTVKCADGLRVVKLSNIVSCEYLNHTVIFRTVNGEEITSRTFRESFSEYCAPILKNRNFLQCHNSYIINMRRVERFARESFTLCRGKVVPIAAKRYPLVREAYMDYLTAKKG